MFGRTHALGIDIGDDAMRVVGLQKAGGGYTVAHLACYPWDDQRTPEEAARLLAALRRQTGRVPAAIALPASGCTLKTASLPPGKPADLARIARFEAEQQFPLPMRELVWGYALAPEPTGRWHTVLAGARRSLVEERLAVVQQAGLLPTVVLPAPLAAAGSPAKLDGRYLLVVAGTAWTDLCLYDGERLLGCRSVLAGDPKDEGWTVRIVREARPWIAGGDSPGRILLLGTVTSPIARQLAEAIELPVEVGDAWQDIRNAVSVQENLSDEPAAYATALGLARAVINGHGMNLLPDELVQDRRKGRKYAWSLAGLAVVAALLIPLIMSGQQALGERQAELQKLTRQVRQVRRNAGVAPDGGIITAQRILDTLHTTQSDPLEILWALSTGLPEKVTLTDMTYDRGKAVILKGRIDSNERLASVLAAINRLAVFERVSLNYASAVKDDVTAGYDFQITCLLPVAGDPTLPAGRNAATQSSTGRVIR